MSRNIADNAPVLCFERRRPTLQFHLCLQQMVQQKHMAASILFLGQEEADIIQGQQAHVQQFHKKNGAQMCRTCSKMSAEYD